jgi:hypothetical protein
MKRYVVLALMALGICTGYRTSAEDANQATPPLKAPFRLRFISYDSDSTVLDPERMSFQVHTLDIQQRSEFLKIGDIIPKTPFRLEKFQYRETRNPTTGETEDASELTLVNVSNGKRVVITLNKITDASDAN